MTIMATAAVPPTIQPYFDKGVLAYTQGSYEYAIDLLTFVVKHQPDATEARRYLRLAVQKQYSQSPPSWLSRLIAGVASLPLRWMAAFSVIQGQPRKAVQLYEQLLSFQPRSRSLLL